MVIVCAKTDSAKGAHGVSLFLVEEGMAGFQKGKKLKKMGMKAQDTAELFFEDLRVPASAMLGPISPSLPISPHLSPSLPISPHISGRLARPRAREAGCEERAPPLPVDEQAAGRTDARGTAPCAQALFTPSSCEQAVAMLEALRARLDGAAEAPRRPRAHFTQTHNPAPKTHKHRPSRRERRRRQSEGH